jgi:hypothetical protein
MFTALKELAQVSLGFKSLQNNFFYVGAETINTYGIEKRFLRPISMLANLNPEAYLQQPEPDTWLFHCQEKLQDLRGTGAHRYIETMADHAANEKKQSGKTTTIREALEAQAGGLWYAPKALPHKRNVWIRKAFGGIYSPFLFNEPELVDQRLNSVTPLEDADISWEELAAVLTNTAFSYSLEINGSSSMGAGVLEAPTTKIRDYPVLDIRKLDKAKRRQLVSLAKFVWANESPVDWTKERAAIGKRLRELDQWVLEQVKTKVTVDRLYRDHREACLARVGLAKDKVKKANKKKADNIGNVAEKISATVSKIIKSKSFPENFIDSELDASFDISRELVKTIQMLPLLGEVELKFRGEGGKKLVTCTYPQAQGEAIVRAVLWGRSSFSLSSDERATQKAIVEFLKWVKEIDSSISQAIANSALGTGYEELLRTDVFKRLGMHPAAMEANLMQDISL